VAGPAEIGISLPNSAITAPFTSRRMHIQKEVLPYGRAGSGYVKPFKDKDC
jgi:hypothetical protein